MDSSFTLLVSQFINRFYKRFFVYFLSIYIVLTSVFLWDIIDLDGKKWIKVGISGI